MNRNTFWGTVTLGLLMVLAGIVTLEGTNYSYTPQLIPSQSMAHSANINFSQLVQANNDFGFDFYRQILQQESDPKTNLIVSPHSVAIALGVLSNGTGGNTRAEILGTLGLTELTPEIINRSYGELLKTLQNQDDVQLNLANSLWVNREVQLKPTFVEQAQEFFRASVQQLDFADPTSPKIINDWVAKQTQAKIPQIVESLSPQDALHLINAIYFKGVWSKKFAPEATRPRPFDDGSGTEQEVAMMHQTGKYRYYQNQQFQAVRLPFGVQQEIGMYLFLPAETSNLKTFQQQLNLENWQEWLSHMRSQPGKVALPKFKSEFATELPSILQALGLSQSFAPQQADFTPLTDQNVALSSARHKAIIEVDEAGAEAAAVTSIGVRVTSARPTSQPFDLEFNRPFFFAICDDISQTILFMGNVVAP